MLAVEKIRSFNEDKPYGRFVLEQLAGDVLYPNTRDGIVGTGFIATGPFDYVGHIELREGLVDKDITRNLDRDDMVSTAMNTFVSITVQCARCHDHKFDPISQEDYYSLQAVFAGVERADRPYPDSKTESLRRSLTERNLAIAALPKQRMVYAAASDFRPIGNFWPAPGGKPRPIHLLHRGGIKSPGKLMQPGTVGLVKTLASRFKLENPDDERQRRVALARWIVNRDNPLTWRSIVNRIWQYHFGRAIVDSPNDFGRMGTKPTHPQLLDWLAVEMRDGGAAISNQSIKQLHRLIVSSATYRQVSTSDEAKARLDAGNRFLWRINRRRLEAEAIRDSVLAVAGKLDTTMGGPGFRRFGFKDDHSPHYKYNEHDPDDPARQLCRLYGVYPLDGQ